MSDNNSVSDETSSGTFASPLSRAELATVPTILTDHSGSPSYESRQNASFSSQSDCHSLLSKILGDDHQRALVCRLSGDDAQLMANYLDLVTRDANIFEASGRRRARALLCNLAKSSKVFPGCYELKGVEQSTEIIGSGGFADVYKGRYRGRAVCLKAFRVHQEQSYNEGIVKARAYELTLWAHLQHKNILPFYGVYYSGGSLTKLCLISPWMEGGNIDTYLRKFPEAPRVVFIFDILDGLTYLHGLLIVHDDLKPENILISNNGFALITDFGVSSIAATSQLSSVTSRGGSYHYQAPELILPDDVARSTIFSDIWSFACLCFEILANKKPFYWCQRGIQMVAAMGRQALPSGPESVGREEIGDQLWDLLTRCWNYEPKDRPTCKMLQDSITKLGFWEYQSRAGLGDNGTFGGTMREEYNDRLDYARLQGILFHINNTSTVDSSPTGESASIIQITAPRPGDSPFLTEVTSSTHRRQGTSISLANSQTGAPVSSNTPLHDSTIIESTPDAKPIKPDVPEPQVKKPSDPALVKKFQEEHQKESNEINPSQKNKGSASPGPDNVRRSSELSSTRQNSENRDNNSDRSKTWWHRILKKNTQIHPSSHASGSVDSSVDPIGIEGVKPEDHVIAVLGPTGAGKSTFISTATGRGKGVGHGLEPVMRRVSAVRISTPGVADVVLVDTPGFDDTRLSELDIMKGISDWFGATYRKKVTLSGILYLHRISDNRMGGTQLKNLDMFRKLCGEDGFRKVTIVTTMWQEVDQDIGLARQDELQKEYCTELVNGGSKIMPFDANRDSAWAILDPIIAREFDNRSIRIQKGLVDLRMDLPNTTAGKRVFDLVGKLLERQNGALREMMEELKKTTDPAVMDALVAELHNIRKEREKVMADMRQLDSSVMKICSTSTKLQIRHLARWVLL